MFNFLQPLFVLLFYLHLLVLVFTELASHLGQVLPQPLKSLFKHWNLLLLHLLVLGDVLEEA